MKRLQVIRHDESPYERPNQTWVCGHASDGRACRLGPDKGGNCVAKAECAPRREGDRWSCTRPGSAGGECSGGPHPDGRCAHPITACSPVRSERSRRGVVAWAATFLALGAVIVAVRGVSTGSGSLASPGSLSAYHERTTAGCSTCHVAADGTEWIAAAAGAVAGDSEKCLACHHEPEPGSAFLAHGVGRGALAPAGGAGGVNAGVLEGNAAIGTAAIFAKTSRSAHEAPACAACHPEHRGRAATPIELPDARCQSCHAKAFAGFAVGHPDFAVASHGRATAIAFDHRGAQHAQLGCATCHDQDAMGRRMLLRGFDVSCASCHGGSIGRKDTALLSVGDSCPAPAAVAATPVAVVSSAATMTPLRPIAATPALGEWTAASYRPVAHADPVARHLLDGIAATGRAPGVTDDGGRCTSCHSVQQNRVAWTEDEPGGSGASRFGAFSHREHTAQGCASCHGTPNEHGFAPVTRASCTPCHSRGGAGEQCTLCHTYHAEPFITRTASAAEETVIGPTACAGCHRHDNAWLAWSQSHHAKRIVGDDHIESTKAIAGKLGLPEPEKSRRCAPCHATMVGGKVVAGVSCEACHGPAREWIGLHADESRDDRWASSLRAGMTRPSDTVGIAERCYGCHVITDEGLVEAGHLGGSSLELVTWTQGEVRHGFLDTCTRAEVPTNREATPEHRRVLYAVGALVDLEASLRGLAQAKNPPHESAKPADASADWKPAMEAPFFEKMRDRVVKASSKVAAAAEKEPALAPRLGAIAAAVDSMQLKDATGPASVDHERVLSIARAARKAAESVAREDGTAWAGLDGAIPKRPKGAPFGS